MRLLIASAYRGGSRLSNEGIRCTWERVDNMLTSFTDATGEYGKNPLRRWRWSGALLVGGLS